MAASKSEKGTSGKASRNAIEHRDLKFDAGTGQETMFKRADLIFEGVDHAHGSYEVRVFLNNKKADETTARSAETGYAGRFVVFGHGHCFGEEGHCDASIAAIPSPTTAPGGGRQHPMTPGRHVLTITEQLDRILNAPGKRLETLTLVPVSKAPRREERGGLTDLFKFGGVSLRTYR